MVEKKGAEEEHSRLQWRKPSLAIREKCEVAIDDFIVHPLAGLEQLQVVQVEFPTRGATLRRSGVAQQNWEGGSRGRGDRRASVPLRLLLEACHCFFQEAFLVGGERRQIVDSVTVFISEGRRVWDTRRRRRRCLDIQHQQGLGTWVWLLLLQFQLLLLWFVDRLGGSRERGRQPQPDTLHRLDREDSLNRGHRGDSLDRGHRCG